MERLFYNTKHFKKSFFLIVCLCLACIQTVSSIELNFKKYKVEDGLSSNTIFAILQDSDGFMWIGTEDGINKFDGYTFKTYRNIPRDSSSIVNNYVYSIYEDSKQNLWIGTETGISVYNKRTDNFNFFNKKTKNGISITDKISNIIRGQSDEIWISSFKQGVFMYNPKNDELYLYSLNKYLKDKTLSINLSCVYKDRENTIWAIANGTIHKLYKFDKKLNDFVPAIPAENRSVLDRLSGYSILEDTFGYLWIGSWNNGIYKIDKKKGIIDNFLEKETLHIHSLTEVSPGKLLIGSDNGLITFNISPSLPQKATSHLLEPDLSNRFVYPIYKDREGGLWVGTYYGGLNYASSNRNYFKSYTHHENRNSLSGNVVSSFCEDNDGNIWIGMDDGGLNFFDRKTEKFTIYKPSKESYLNVHGLCLDGDFLWIGTYSDGLNCLNTKTGTYKYYYSDPKNPSTLDANNIYALYKDSQNNVWAGTTSGINLYDREKDSFKRVKSINGIVSDILQTDNIIWFATNGDGLHKYNLDTNEWQSYTFDPNNQSSLISKEVGCLCLDEFGQLWIGTYGGLCKYIPEKDSFETVYINFPSQSIYSIFSEGEYLWFTSSKSLVRFNPSNKKFRVFTSADGLLSDQFIPRSGLKTKSGKIYIGTASGFNTFYPKQIEENRVTPPVAITDFEIFNLPVNIYDYIDPKTPDEIILSHNQNFFTFKFSALSYFASEKNSYEYILEGFDKDWIHAEKNRTANYTNIPPGKYHFKVRASNNDGIWNNNGINVKVTINPPFWWNIWSISLYIILIGIAIYFAYENIKKKEIKKNQEKIDKIKIEQEKEIYDSKIRFFTIIAHEIRTPVSLIIGPLEQISKKINILPEDIQNNLKIIGRNSQRLLSLVNQLLDFRKVEDATIQILMKNDDLYYVIANIYNRFKPFVENKHIRFVFSSDTENFTTAVDEDNLTKIISNLLSNASKYTNDYIELSLKTNIGTNHYSISVIDNGVGISENEINNIFKAFYQVTNAHKSGTGIGLYLVKAIVDTLNGEISVKNRKDGGLVVTVNLPIISMETSNTENEDYNIENKIKEYKGEPLEKRIENNANEEEKSIVLIVEDNIDMQEFIYSQLKKYYDVLIANNGVDGIKVLETNSVDLIVSDIMMPLMDGIEFCSKVKNNPLWNHIPFVLLTAKTNIATKIESMEVGADLYIEKPFSSDYLLAAVKNLLHSRKELLKKFTKTPFSTLKSISGNELDGEFLSKLDSIIQKNISNEEFSIENLAEELGISSSGLFAKIKNLTGTTPNKLLLSVRLKKSAELLLQKRYRINEVCYMVGFSNPSYFAKCFQKQYGVLPKDFNEDSLNENV